MEERKEIKFIGSGKQVNEKYINGSICLSDIPKEDITESQKNGKKYLNITIGRKNEPDQRGKTHYISVNDWKPEKKETFSQPDNDVPF